MVDWYRDCTVGALFKNTGLGIVGVGVDKTFFAGFEWRAVKDSFVVFEKNLLIVGSISFFSYYYFIVDFGCDPLNLMCL